MSFMLLIFVGDIMQLLLPNYETQYYHLNKRITFETVHYSIIDKIAYFSKIG